MKLPYILNTTNCDTKLKFNICQYLPYVRLFEKIRFEGDTIDLSECRLLVCDEVGVGKTAETGIIINELRYGESFYNKGLRILIVCPAKLKLNWKKELDRLTGINARLFDRDIRHFYHTTIIGFDELKNCQREELPLIDVLIVDEAHYLRNGKKTDDNSGRQAAVRELIEKKEKSSGGKIKGMMKLFLSGTPIFNKESDLKNLAELMGIAPTETIPTTKTTKAAAHCKEAPTNGGIQVITKLPIYELCEIDIQDDAEREVFLACRPAVEESDDDDFEIDEDNDDIEESNSNHGNFRQYCANSIHYLNSWAERTPEISEELDTALQRWRNKGRHDSKLEYLQKLLDGLKPDNQPFKVVIFVEHPETARYLKVNLKGFEHIAILSGSTEKPALETKMFRQTNSDYIMICTKAAQEGHNFQFCPHLIHYEFPFTPAAIWQRNGRIDRMGQKNTPHIYYFKTVCFDGSADVSYDERYYDILVKKMKAIENNSDLIPYTRILPDPSKEYMIDSSKEKSDSEYIAEYIKIRDRVLEAFKDDAGKLIDMINNKEQN